MTDTKPRDYVTGIILFTIVMLAGITMINRAATVDATFIDDGTTYSQFAESLNKSATLNAQIAAMETAIKADSDPNIVDMVNLFFQKGFSVLMSIFNSFSFMQTMIWEVSRIFAWIVPNWLPALIISLITTMLVFSVISAILQRDI